MSHYDNPATAAYRATLDRLPDEIALAIGLHVYDAVSLWASATCVCGWAVREAMARGLNMDPAEIATDLLYVPWECVRRFGGSCEEWEAIFTGVCDSRAPLIEEALFDRVMAAATGGGCAR